MQHFCRLKDNLNLTSLRQIIKLTPSVYRIGVTSLKINPLNKTINTIKTRYVLKQFVEWSDVSFLFTSTNFDLIRYSLRLSSDLQKLSKLWNDTAFQNVRTFFTLIWKKNQFKMMKSKKKILRKCLQRAPHFKIFFTMVCFIWIWREHCSFFQQFCMFCEFSNTLIEIILLRY